MDERLLMEILLVLLAAAGVTGSFFGYRNGFWDGVKWAVEGEGYPSKPSPRWWGWRQLREIVAATESAEAARQEERERCAGVCDREAAELVSGLSDVVAECAQTIRAFGDTERCPQCRAAGGKHKMDCSYAEHTNPKPTKGA